MSVQETLNYERIAKAIAYIQQNFRQQPSLDEIAEHIHLSPFHFQRLFAEWAGTTPKKFLQYINIQYAKQLLKGKDSLSLFNAAYHTGLSGTGRLHDLFINIEGMTPAEYKNEGKNLSINYNFADSPFGKIITAATTKGICHISFVESEEQGKNELIMKFPKAIFHYRSDHLQKAALLIFQSDWKQVQKIKLHLKGTDFQLKVWEALLKIPVGNLSTYQQIAQQIGSPKASRAVGSAIGSNPIAYIIPCHRVIQSSGIIGGYMWGNVRKQAIIGWEAAKHTKSDGLI